MGCGGEAPERHALPPTAPHTFLVAVDRGMPGPEEAWEATCTTPHLFNRGWEALAAECRYAESKRRGLCRACNYRSNRAVAPACV
jgi:hypothetical protein